MYRHFVHVFYALILSLAAFSTQAYAVSLGKMDVASHLGEPFYGEVALNLESGEDISDVIVELASPTDFRILEVFRESAINALRIQLKQDSRGSRVELLSDSAIESPFFNLVLKVRFGRSTHFKKFPVFLELPSSAKTQVIAPQPQVESIVRTMEPQPVIDDMPSDAAVQADSQVSPDASQPVKSFEAFDGWARTARYGPMVFGDTITTVASRLQVDERFTRQQVMMALYEKNRSKFSQDNINLIQAGTYLDVPTADEVAKISPLMAKQMLAEQAKAWKGLAQEPEYASVQEAQENRYSKRVRVGENASGVASKPMDVANENKEVEKTGESAGDENELSAIKPVADEAAAASNVVAKSPEKASQSNKKADAAGASAVGQLLANEAVQQLTEQNAALEEQLFDLEAKLNEYEKRQPGEVEAAATAQLKKLEIQLARMQSQLDEARQNSGGGESAAMLNWLSWILIGLVVLLSAAVGFLLRRGRQHPQMNKNDAADVFDESIGAEEEFAFAEPEMPVTEDMDSADSTVQMSADDLDMEMDVSLPDLTDEDTSEMEAFQEDDEEPDPNVDYLSEADVYMRYGMEEEAEKQVEMALKLDSSNQKAHLKLVEIRKARGDNSGVNNAINAAKLVLMGEALAVFNSAVGGEADESSSSSDVADGGLDFGAEESTEVASAQDDGLEMPSFDDDEFSTDVEDDDSGLDMSFDDFDAPTASAVSSSQSKDDDDMDISFDDLDLSSFGADKSSAVSAKKSEEVDDDDMEMSFDDLDMSSFDIDDTDEPTSTGGAKAAGSADAEASDDGLDMSIDDFDLSSFDESESSVNLETDSSDNGLEMSFDDLDVSSFGADESKDTSLADEAVTTDSSDDGLEMSFDDLDLTSFETDDSDLLSSIEDDSLAEVVDGDLSEGAVDTSLGDFDLSAFDSGDENESVGDEEEKSSVDEFGLDMSIDDFSSEDAEADSADASLPEMNDNLLETLEMDDGLDLDDFGLDLEGFSGSSAASTSSQSDHTDDVNKTVILSPSHSVTHETADLSLDNGAVETPSAGLLDDDSGFLFEPLEGEEIGLDLDAFSLSTDPSDELDADMDEFSSTIEANFDDLDDLEGGGGLSSVELDLNSDNTDVTHPDFKLESFDGSDDDLDISMDLDDLLNELDMDDESGGKA